MKCVFTFRGVCFDNPKVQKEIGGFYNAECFFRSFLLSFMMARQHFDDIVLISDEIGYKIIEPVELPFDKVYTDLDCRISERESEYWSISKAKVLEYIDCPYVHVDYDFFMFKPIPPKMKESGVFCQSSEYFMTELYEELIVDYIENGEKGILTCLDSFIEENDPLKNLNAINTGIIGGSNLEFLRGYYSDIQLYLNSISLKTHDSKHVTDVIFLEQYYLWVKAKMDGVKIITYHDILGRKLKNSLGDESYFRHLLGKSKKNKEALDYVVEKTENIYPYYSKKIKKACDFYCLV